MKFYSTILRDLKDIRKQLDTTLEEKGDAEGWYIAAMDSLNTLDTAIELLEARMKKEIGVSKYG